MISKTERLEMRLDADTAERLDEWREGQDDRPSRSEAVRRLIDLGLEQHTPEGFRLNQPERLQTWMLSEILKNQINERKGDKDKKYDLKTVTLIQEAIFGGHYWALRWEMPGVMHSHVDDPKKVRLVVDVLDMWNFIERAYAGFSDADKKRIADAIGFASAPQFLGFDGNNETEYLGIARFLVEQLGRFEGLKGRDFNSHCPTVASYGRMASVFETIRPSLIGRELSADEVITLLKRE